MEHLVCPRIFRGQYLTAAVIFDRCSRAKKEEKKNKDRTGVMENLRGESRYGMEVALIGEVVMQRKSP